MDKNRKREALIEALSKGAVEEAALILGRPYAIQGRIVHGLGKGKTVGMPTCNMELSEDMVLPKDAVYQTAITIDGESYRSLTSVGPRPTIDDSDMRTVETFILGFDRDVYDKVVKLEFIKYIREIVKLNSLEEVRDLVLEDMKAMI